MKKNQQTQIGRPHPGGLSASVKTLISLFAIVATASLHAADQTWTGGNTPDFNWNTNANWSGSIPVIDDQLFFDGSVGLLNTNNISSNTEFSGLTFKSTAGAFTLFGNAITLANGGGIPNNSANPQTNRITLAVTNSSTVNYITTPGGGTLVFPSGVTWANAAVTNSTLVLNSPAVVMGAQFGIGGNANGSNNLLLKIGRAH